MMMEVPDTLLQRNQEIHCMATSQFQDGVINNNVKQDDVEIIPAEKLKSDDGTWKLKKISFEEPKKTTHDRDVLEKEIFKHEMLKLKDTVQRLPEFAVMFELYVKVCIKKEHPIAIDEITGPCSISS